MLSYMPGTAKPNTALTSNLPGPTYTTGADGLPTVAERLVDPIIPATEDNFICCDGPCRHYCDCVLDSSDVGEGRELVRYCMRLSTATELMDLTDGAVYACGFYAPPWWSVRGWRRWARNRRYLREARRTILERDLRAAGMLDDDDGDEIIVLD